MSHYRRGFTLLEMLIATVIAAILMGGVLVMTAGIGRDRARVARYEAGGPLHSTLTDTLRFDLTHAMTMSPAVDGKLLVLVGHGGIDLQTLKPTGRLTRVTYEVRGQGKDAALFRRQEYMDDPARPQAWTDLVADGVQAIGVSPDSNDYELIRERGEEDEEDPVTGKPVAVQKRKRGALETYTVPTRVGIRVQRGNDSLEAEVWTR